MPAKNITDGFTRNLTWTGALKEFWREHKKRLPVRIANRKTALIKQGMSETEAEAISSAEAKAGAFIRSRRFRLRSSTSWNAAYRWSCSSVMADQRPGAWSLTKRANRYRKSSVPTRP